MLEYAAYRDEHPFINWDFPVVKQFYVEQFAKEAKIKLESQKSSYISEQSEQFSNIFDKKENKNSFLTIDSVATSNLDNLNNLDLNLNSLNHNKN
jgi:hypothetical protein